jgi:hypothetical protein
MKGFRLIREYKPFRRGNLKRESWIGYLLSFYPHIEICFLHVTYHLQKKAEFENNFGI